MTTLFHQKYNIIFIGSGYNAPFSSFHKKKSGWQFIDKDIQERLLIHSTVKTFSSLLSTSSHYSHAKV